MKILESLKKVDSKVFIALGIGATGLIQTVLTGMNQTHEKNELKETLKAEILEEILSKKD